MKILFTKKQYVALVELLYLADWMLHAHDEAPRSDTAHYKALVQSLLSHAKDMQAEELVDKVDDELVFSGIVEERVQSFVQDYDAQSMWEELVPMLGYRDAERAVGLKALQEMSGDKRIDVLLKHEAPWAEEFTQHGLARLVVGAAGVKGGV